MTVDRGHEMEVSESALETTAQVAGTTLSAPTMLVATANSDHAVSLSWNSVEGTTGYRVFREAFGSTSATLLATVAGTTYVDSSSALVPGSRWSYYVKAYQTIVSAPSATISVTMIPSAPLGLAATANGNDTVSLSWAASPAGQGVTGYSVYREAAGSTSATLVATVAGTTYLDSSSALVAGSGWSYYLTAVNATGASAASATVSVTMSADPEQLATLTFVNTSASTQAAEGVSPIFGWVFKEGDIPSGAARSSSSMACRSRTRGACSLIGRTAASFAPRSCCGLARQSPGAVRSPSAYATEERRPHPRRGPSPRFTRRESRSTSRASRPRAAIYRAPGAPG